MYYQSREWYHEAKISHPGAEVHVKVLSILSRWQGTHADDDSRAAAADVRSIICCRSGSSGAMMLGCIKP